MGNRTQQSAIVYPSAYGDSKKEKQLHAFMKTMQKMYKNGELHPEEIKLCESIPDWKWQRKAFVDRDEFIAWCKKNKIKGYTDFVKIKNRPDYIPSAPQTVYDGWKWKEVSGYGVNVSFKEFIKWCKKNGIDKAIDKRKWLRKIDRPNDIPCHPERVYKDFSWKMI